MALVMTAVLVALSIMQMMRCCHVNRVGIRFGQRAAEIVINLLHAPSPCARIFIIFKKLIDVFDGFFNENITAFRTDPV